MRPCTWGLALLLASSVAGAEGENDKPVAPPEAPAPSAAPTAQREVTLYQQLDSLYRQRDVPEVYAEFRQKLDQALKQNPHDFELLWRAARAKNWDAEGAADDRLKKQLGKEAWHIAERAVALRPQRVEGHHQAALGIGQYSQAIGILKALGEGLEGKFNERIDQALTLNPDHEGSAPRVAKGRYHYKLPWPKRSLKKSRQLLETAIQRSPGSARAYVYLAETQLADDEPKQAQATLQKLAALPPGEDPPETRRMQLLGKAVEKKVQQELDGR